MSEFGRRIPTDWTHVSKYGIRRRVPQTVARVEDVLPLHPFWRDYDQGQQGACVGFGSSQATTIINRVGRSFPRYDAEWLYREAQLIDEWQETPPEEGTSVRAAMDVLRDRGHSQILRRRVIPATPDNGIQENRWATTVDEMRSCLAAGVPIVIGVTWYRNFSLPYQRSNREWWVGEGSLGRIEGGHCVCVYGASDKRQAFKFVNSWGAEYPLTWIPYTIMQRLLDDYGEATIITDRLPEAER